MSKTAATDHPATLPAQRDARRGFARRMRVIGLLCCALALTACANEESEVAAIAKLPPNTQANTLRTKYYAHEITAMAALNLAHDQIEKTGDAASVIFAGSVLAFLDQVEPDIDREKVNEFFWMRIGTLAANAAAKARAANDSPLARSLVLAGPDRWQTDAYWQQNPAHDALASMLMYENGEGAEAAARLKDRPQLLDEPAAALAEIEKGLKKGKGRK